MKEITIDLYACFGKVKQAEAGILHGFLHEDCDETLRPALLVIPGGAYGELCFRENRPIARRFFGEGFNTFYIDYSCGEGVGFSTALYECGMALLYIKQYAAELCLNGRTAAIGFSAGGHLAGLLGNGLKKFCGDLFSDEQRQFLSLDALIYCYPVVSTQPGLIHPGSFQNLLKETCASRLHDVSLEKLIQKDACPAFIFHCADDPVVPVGNALVLANAYAQNNIPFELHVFPQGGHGVALPTRECWAEYEMHLVNPDLIVWYELALKWLQDRGLVCSPDVLNETEKGKE